MISIKKVPPHVSFTSFQTGGKMSWIHVRNMDDGIEMIRTEEIRAREGVANISENIRVDTVG